MSTNSELLERRNKAVPRGVASATGVFAARAENAELWDVEGKRYIDFAGGIAVLNTGHRHPKVMKAIEAQLQRFTHPCFQVTPYEPYVALAEKLNRLAPSKGPNKTIFLTTGAEAIENAVKIARNATKRPAIISFVGGFHGRTLMTMALTGKVDPYKKGFGPFPGEVYHAPYPNKFHDVSTEDSLRALEFLFKADVEPSRCRGKAASTWRRSISCASSARSATSTAFCWSSTRSSAASAVPEKCSQSSTRAWRPISSPWRRAWRAACRSRR